MLNEILNEDALHFCWLIHKIYLNYGLNLTKKIILTYLRFIFSALVFLLFAAIFIYTNCNVIDMQAPRPDCSHATKDHLFVRHPCACSTYYVCLTDPPIPMECPDGLQFNETLQTCDFAINVNCVKEPGC